MRADPQQMPRESISLALWSRAPLEVFKASLFKALVLACRVVTLTSPPVTLVPFIEKRFPNSHQALSVSNAKIHGVPTADKYLKGFSCSLAHDKEMKAAITHHLLPNCHHFRYSCKKMVLWHVRGRAIT